MRARHHRLGSLAMASAALLSIAVATRDASADPTGDLNDFAGGVFGDGASGNASVQSVTGAMTYSYSFQTPPARGPVQPSIGLTYSSSARDREAGYGWGLNLPTIELKPLSGFPKFEANGTPIGEERYTFSGSPIVRICTVGSCPAEPNTQGHPSWATGWRYFRHQVEGSYARIYQSHDRRTWRVQLKGGRVLELGATKTTSGWDDYPVPAAIETDRDVPSGIVRWRLVVDRDGIHPKNSAVYKWEALGTRGLIYLTSIYDTPPLVGDPWSLSGFANHTQLDWQPSGFIDTRYAYVDRAIPDYRLVRVGTASKPLSGTGKRKIVRTYELEYLTRRQDLYIHGQHAPLWGHNFLKKITLHGSCDADEDATGNIPSPVCQTTQLPPTTFEYSSGAMAPFVASTPTILGPAPGSVNTNDVFKGPGEISLLDVDRDGLPDVLQGWGAACTPGKVTEVREEEPFNPGIWCRSPSDPTIDQVYQMPTRPARAYMNRGTANGTPQFGFQCLDTGAGPGSIAELAMQGRASFLTGGGPNLLGRWSDGNVLWEATDLWGRGKPTAPFVPIRVRPLTGSTAVGGCEIPGFDPAQFHPHGRFEIQDSYDWSRVSPRTMMLEYPGFFADVDGDGLTDLLVRSGDPTNPLEPARVIFTRLQSKKASPEGRAKLILFDTTDQSPGNTALVPRAHQQGNRFFYVDMNGDGALDIVTQPGPEVLRVRPGNGRGVFGCEQARQPGVPCTANAPPTESYDLQVVNFGGQTFPTPWGVGPQGEWHTPMVHDVTGDGLPDLLDYNGVTGYLRLWVNVDGQHFTCPLSNPEPCVVGRFVDDVHGNNPPANLTYGIRIQFADMNGDGVDDIITATTAGAFVGRIFGPAETSDVRATRPGLLVRVDNGQGATTSVKYHSIQELDLAATASGEPWAHHSPVVEPVVTQISTKDTTSANGGTLAQPYAFERKVSYTYRDPAYDRWQRRFVGFRKVAQQVGTDPAITETTRWFGPCENDTIAPVSPGTPGPDSLCPQTSDDDGVIDATYKAMVGRVVRIDRYAPGLINQTAPGYQWSKIFTYDRPQLVLAPANERTVRVAYPHRIETHVFDTAQNVTLDVAGSVALTGGDRVYAAPSQTGKKVIVESVLLDAATGSVLETRELGHEAGGDAQRVTRFSLDGDAPGITCTSDWQCRPNYVISLQREQGIDVPMRKQHFFYAGGDLERVEAYLADAQWVERRHSGGRGFSTGSPAQAATGWKVVGRYEYDALTGVPTKIEGPGSASSTPASCTTFTLDGPFHQYAETVRSFTNGCVGDNLEAHYTFDRRFGIAINSTAPDLSMREVVLDPYGRVTATHIPDADNPGFMVTGSSAEYFDDGPLPHVRSHDYPSPDVDMQTVRIMNGVGEQVAAFESDDTAGKWIVRDYVLRDLSGRVFAAYRPWKQQTASDPHLLAQTAGTISLAGGAPPITAGRDAFGRHTATSENGQILVQKTYSPLATEIRDAEQLPGGGHVGAFQRVETDGHGQVSHVHEVTTSETITTNTLYDALGHPVQVVKSSTLGGLYYRTLVWDSLGRLTANYEPNTGKNGYAWRYAWDDANRLVATSDARGCGKDIYYDGLGRIVGEDHSPCANHHAEYSTPNLATGEGLEATYRYDAYETGQLASDGSFTDTPQAAKGRLVALRDRGSLTRFNYDPHGNARRVARRIARPFNEAGGDGYAADWHVQRTDVDQADRIQRKSTGVTLPAFLVNGESVETRSYKHRGMLANIGSSYGALIRTMEYEADGQPSSIELTDAARTTMDFQYDARRRLEHFKASRNGPPTVWSTPSTNYSLPPPDTTQLVLADVTFTLDNVGNPTRIEDTSTSFWAPGHATTKVRNAQYDDLYRLTWIEHDYGTDNVQRSPFRAEINGNDRRPVPLVNVSTRLNRQAFTYDFMGNILQSADDTNTRFDRSLGTINHGTPTDGPNQLRSNAGGDVNAAYDEAGNMVRLKVQRAGNCPAMSGVSKCAQWFEYSWDEVGQLARAQRWDFDLVVPDLPEGEVPAATPQWDLHYAYSDGSRTLKTSTDDAGNSTSTLEIFDSLRYEHVLFDALSGNYAVSEENVHLYIAGFAHVLKDPLLPRPARLGMPDGNPVHILLTIPDHLGSTGIVIDAATSEVVERSSHQAFGAIESDFRPDRWSAQREQYKFTGKEEDLEVGLTYFGARYYHARLNRWISPDPLTIHGLGADLNPYAYVNGRALAAIDPFGLEGEQSPPPSGSEPYTTIDGGGTHYVPAPVPPDPLAEAAGKAQEASSGLQVGPVEVPQVVIDHMMNSPAGQAAALIEQTERRGPQAIADAYKGGYRTTLNTVTGRFQLGTRIFGAPKTQAEVIGAKLEEHLVTLGQRIGVGAVGAVAAAAEAGAVANAGVNAAAEAPGAGRGAFYVYRQLSAADRTAFDAGQALNPKGVGGTIAQQVSGKDTGFISAGLTRQSVAKYASGNGLVRINVAKVLKAGTGFVEHGNVLQALRRAGDFKGARNAEGALEVLFKGPIPRDAVELLRK